VELFLQINLRVLPVLPRLRLFEPVVTRKHADPSERENIPDSWSSSCSGHPSVLEGPLENPDDAQHGIAGGGQQIAVAIVAWASIALGGGMGTVTDAGDNGSTPKSRAMKR
jgi:hypothetical protein